MAIEYNYPVEKLDELISMIYDRGMTPMMTPDLRAEVELRYQEMLHGNDDDDDDEDTAFMSAKRKHEEVMKNIEQQRRKSHSRNVIILDLTDEEQQELHDSMEVSYVRSDPNSFYNLSDEELAGDAERQAIYRRLQSLGKVYYHQDDYRNAISIVKEAIEYSLRNDYPWLSYEEACKEFAEGRIRYSFAQLPVLYIDYNTQISDPKILAGIVSGDISLIDKDTKPVKKKKVKSNPVSIPYTVVGDAEYSDMVKVHQAGFNTDISTVLKSCSTIYSSYVIPKAFSYQQGKPAQLPSVDWSQPGAGDLYFDLKYGVKRNPSNEIVGLLNEANDRKLNHTIGHRLKEFPESFNPQRAVEYKTISNSLEQHDEAIQIERRLMDLMRESNPGL